MHIFHRQFKIRSLRGHFEGHYKIGKCPSEKSGFKENQVYTLCYIVAVLLVLRRWSYMPRVAEQIPTMAACPITIYYGNTCHTYRRYSGFIYRIMKDEVTLTALLYFPPNSHSLSRPIVKFWPTLFNRYLLLSWVSTIKQQIRRIYI